MGVGGGARWGQGEPAHKGNTVTGVCVALDYVFGVGIYSSPVPPRQNLLGGYVSYNMAGQDCRRVVNRTLHVAGGGGATASHRAQALVEKEQRDRP